VVSHGKLAAAVRQAVSVRSPLLSLAVSLLQQKLSNVSAIGFLMCVVSVLQQHGQHCHWDVHVHTGRITALTLALVMIWAA